MGTFQVCPLISQGLCSRDWLGKGGVCKVSNCLGAAFSMDHTLWSSLNSVVVKVCYLPCTFLDCSRRDVGLRLCRPFYSLGKIDLREKEPIPSQPLFFGHFSLRHPE